MKVSQIRKVGVIKKTCSKCHGPLELNRINKQRYCLKCHDTYMREHRPKHSELSALAKQKANVRTRANTALKRGVIKKENCLVCGASAQMHHPDYSKPTQVVWVCRQHHMQIYHA